MARCPRSQGVAAWRRKVTLGKVVWTTVGLILVPCLLLIWVLASANLFGRGPIPNERLDRAIERGLDWLDGSDRYQRLAGAKGVFPIEVWITRKVLAGAPHPGLESDIRRGWQRLLASPLRFWAKLPGEPERPLRPRDRKALMAFLRQDFVETSQIDDHAWDRWFLYAAYPEIRDLIVGDFESMLSEEWSMSFGYELSHRVYAYRMFQQQSPEVAQEYEMAEREERAMATMLREMLLDFRLYDLYYERLAFYLESGRTPRFLDRWIERVLDAQNADGSWNKTAVLSCELANAFGIDCERGGAGYHPTFLAVYALVQYRALRSEGR